jgi:hypothetical protein
MGTRVYALPTFQGNAARKGPSRECQPPVCTFLSCAYRPGRAAACLFRYSLTAIGRYTSWPKAFPLSEITAEAVSKAFISVWVARFGRPQQITTNQGRQIEACLFKSLAAITGCSITRTTAWHPASSGLIERLHRQLKAALMCHADEH